MAFEIIINDKEKFPVVNLRDTNAKTGAEIYSFGALLNRFTIAVQNQEINAVDGFSSVSDAEEHISSGFKSAKLNPFVCRVKNGEFAFEGREHKLKRHYLGTEAIHGLVYDAVYTIADSGADEHHAYATLHYNYIKTGEGFPYPFTVTITYSLENNGRLSVTTSIRNTGNSNMPLNDGWHPYFTLGATVNDLLLWLNTDTLVDFDERLLPTGTVSFFDKFQEPIRIGTTFLDNSFIIHDHRRPSCILTNTKNGLQLSIFAGESYPYLQVYTPPHRASIAVECLSGLPDSFNNGTGLIVAKPDETYTFSTTYQLNTV